MDDKLYEAGWYGVRCLYPLRNLFSTIKRPIIFTVIGIVCSLLTDKEFNELTAVVSNWIVGGFPSIIGFILSGYVLIIGFSGSDFLLRLAKHKKESSGKTLFQTLNSTFAIVISIMVAVYAIGALSGFILSCEISWPFDECSRKTFNFLCMSFLLFAFAYAVNTLFDVVINIFNMGQMANIVALQKLAVLEAAKDKQEAESFLERLLNTIFNIK